ncbi:MAG: GGDEF domain-containing protein [Planctomycetes bacterium]|nr:GGDEF domain-containing protein [Planctomycetota bacterium]
MKRWFWVGARDDVRAGLEQLLDCAASEASLAAATADDLVIVDALAGPPVTAALGGRHAFAGVRWLKAEGRQVYVVVDAEDEIGAQLARFCLANGSLRWHAASRSIDGSELLESRGTAPRPSVDDLLRRVERDLADSGDTESTLQRLLRFERERSPLERLQDPETGLFDGPFAACKIDEEWKRAIRFHQPLSLVLLDLGTAFDSLAGPDRQAALAEAASVFLNECRDIDVLSRFSPSTFLFLLPGTGSDGAEILARRMLAALQQRLPEGFGLQPAAGIATVPSSQIADRKGFLLVADACLQRARAAGGAGQVATTWQ